MAELLGGVVAMCLLGALCGLAFKRKEPGERALAATIAAWVLGSIIAGFGMADGGPFRFDASLIYLPGAIVAYFFLSWHYRKNWVEDEEEGEPTQTPTE
jgi:hypothetical protein